MGLDQEAVQGIIAFGPNIGQEKVRIRLSLDEVLQHLEQALVFSAYGKVKHECKVRR